MTMTGFTTGYGRNEIEPKIAPLVLAVQGAGFITFSSCEGHVEDEGHSLPRLPSVGFYAHEDAARPVHERLVSNRPRLNCSWFLCAGFVHHRERGEWVLGWTLKNGGVIEDGDDATFVKRTVEAVWNNDVPLLVEMFSNGQQNRR